MNAPAAANSGTAVSDWHVYIVECADGSLYTGIARNLEARVNIHNEGKGARYTRSRLPVSLVYREPAADRAAASRREAAIKRLSKAEKLDLVRNAAAPQA